MALLIFEGFDQFDNATTFNSQLLTKGWAVANLSAVPVTGRYSGRAVVISTSSGNIRYDFASAVSTATVGVAIQIVSSFPSNINQGHLVTFCDSGSTGQFGLGINTSGKLCVYRGTTATLVATSTTGLTIGQWNYLEIQVTFHNSTGAYEVKLNGTQVADLTATGVDTCATANNSATGVYFGPYATVAGNHYYDDLYITDTSGSNHTGFLGECRVTTIVPSGAGSSAQFTPSTGSNYANVDEIGASGTAADTDYNSSSTAGHVDSFAISSSSITGSPAVYAVALSVTCRKDDVGTRTLRTRLKSSSATATGSTVTLLAGYGTYRTQHLTDPNTSAAWAVAAVNAMEIGYELVA